MKVEVATAADLRSIVRLVNDAYRGSSKAPGWTDETALLAGQRVDDAALSKLVSSGSTILVMRNTSHVIGCVMLRPVDPSEWYLSMLAVDPDNQAAGLGKALMSSAEMYARERGAQRIRISVINLRESLMAWYIRRGYSRTGVIEPFPYQDASVGTPLRDDLALATLTKPLR
jgi:ribosomal protein S18 acetylase RimI-like enzyme